MLKINDSEKVLQWIYNDQMKFSQFNTKFYLTLYGGFAAENIWAYRPNFTMYSVYAFRAKNS